MIAAWLWLTTALANPASVPDACRQAEETEVITEDGAWVHLHRHVAEGPPVLLVHGISSNHWFMDLGPDRSLAQTLQAAGYDAWTLDLRGHGEARRSTELQRQRKGWTIEDYGRHDLHAAIEHVRATRGVPKVHLVGHSLGGMSAAIYQAHHGDDALASIIAVGSPVDFGDEDPLLGLGRVGMSAGSLFGSLPGPALARTLARVPRLGAIEDFLWAPGSIDAEARKRVLARVAGPLSRQELAHLKRIVREGHLVSADGSLDYTASLSQLETPLLVLAGRGDHIAPPDRVRPYFTGAGSEDKTWVLLGRANGFSHDHGHVDLLLGDTAPAEIYPVIVDWLLARDPPP